MIRPYFNLEFLIVFSPCPLAAHLWREELSIERRPHPDALDELSLGSDAKLHVAHRALTNALDGLHWRVESAAISTTWNAKAGRLQFAPDFKVRKTPLPKKLL